MMVSLKSLMNKAWRCTPQTIPMSFVITLLVIYVMIDYEAWDGAEDLSESESEDGNYDEVSDISDDTSLKEEDEELLLQSFLTMDIDNDAHYIHQLS